MLGWAVIVPRRFAECACRPASAGVATVLPNLFKRASPQEIARIRVVLMVKFCYKQTIKIDFFVYLVYNGVTYGVSTHTMRHILAVVPLLLAAVHNSGAALDMTTLCADLGELFLAAHTVYVAKLIG